MIARELPVAIGATSAAYVYGSNVGFQIPQSPEEWVAFVISLALAVLGVFLRGKAPGVPVVLLAVALSGCAATQRDMVIEEQVVEGAAQAACAGLRASDQYDTALIVAQTLSMMGPEELRAEFEQPIGMAALVPLMRASILQEVAKAAQRIGIKDPDRAGTLLARAVRGCLRGLIAAG